MRVLIDRYVPYLRGVLEPYAEVCYLEPEEFTPASVKDADAIIIRTRTRVNEALLRGSRVRLVCTATIGYDHIDTAYCRQEGIRWVNAPGCNAEAVCDYVEEVLRQLAPASHATIGVVGVGHVGRLVARMAEAKGYRVLTSDPFRAGEADFVDTPLEDIAREADVLTFHTPLTKSGEHPTYHLCDAHLLSLCRPTTLIINAARGGIVDEEALIAAPNPCAIDTWKNEPHISEELLRRASIASQHIAGYSIRGKINASNACLRAVAEYFHLPNLSVDMTQVPPPGDSAPGWLERITQTLREHPEDFESLRECYPLR